jgi:pimeloyl-ACP methyl ester carboxylesterase
MNARRSFAVLTVCLAVSAMTVTSGRLLGQSPGPESIQGKLADGSNYRVVKPAPWNGTIVLDLDFANNPDAAPSAIERWMTANGYAIGGISREPVAYRFRQAVDDLLEVRRLFSAKWNATPTRTLTLGNSRGGFVSRLAMERHPDIFKGAVLSAGGGAGEVGTFNAKLDGLWTLKVLTGAPLTLVGFASQADAMAENGRLAALVTELRSTPAGRARLALAAAFEQFPRWTGGDAPPAPNDHEAQLNQIADQFTFANPAQVRWGVEVVAGGNFSWNHGVDYTALLARSGMADLVEAIYAKSGVSLQADLRQLAQAPRISAEAAAVATAETLTSYSGAIGGPVIVVDNIGDPVDADAYKRAYERTVTRAGRGELLRTTWVRSARHANLSALEKLAGFVKMIERLDTGSWSATTPQAMLAAAAAIDAKSDLELGTARFIDHSPPEMLRPWDGGNWGTYAATLGRSGSR